LNLTEYVRILTRRGWILVLAIVLTAGSGFVLSKLQKPVYRAEQKILIEPARNDFGLTQTLKELISSWVSRLNTQLRAQDVITALKLDMTPEQLQPMVTVSPDLNNLLITVDVDMTSGATAEQVASTYGSQFIEWRTEQNQPLQLADRINAELLDAPHYALFRPNTSINMAAGALLGLLLGGVVVFVLEYLDSNIVRRASDIERYLQLPVLGNLSDTH